MHAHHEVSNWDVCAAHIDGRNTMERRLKRLGTVAALTTNRPQTNHVCVMTHWQLTRKAKGSRYAAFLILLRTMNMPKAVKPDRTVKPAITPEPSPVWTMVPFPFQSSDALSSFPV